MSNSDYLARHNRTLMIPAVTWVKEHELIAVDMVCHKAKLVWGFQFNLQQTEVARR